MTNNLILNIKSFLFENKGLKQTIFKNTIWITVSEVLSKGISFFLLIWLARYFGPDNYGKLAFGLSFVALFAFFIDFGFTSIAIREIARDKSKSLKYTNNILAIEAVLGFFVFILICLLSVIFVDSREISFLICLFGVATILDCFTKFLQSVFCAHERMEFVAISRLFQASTLFIVIIISIFFSISVIDLGYLFIIASIFSLILTLILSRKFFYKFVFNIDLRFLYDILRESWPIGLISFAALFFQSADSVLIGFLKTNLDVGLYNAASRISVGTYFLLGIISSVFMPAISRAFKENSSNFRNIIEKYAMLNFYLGIPIGVGGFFVAPELINLIYGSNYIQSVDVFRILSLSLIFIFMTAVYGQSLIFLDKQRKFLKSYMIGLILNIFMNILLIPYLGIMGAAFSSIITQALILIIVFFEFRKATGLVFGKIFLYSISSSIIMSVAIMGSKRITGFGAISQIILGIFVYFVALYLIYIVKNRKLSFIL